MIRTLFDQLKPAYIQHRNGRLILDGREYETLDVTIRELVPVRKLFRNNKLTCWSINGSPGRDKRLCAFCPDTARCQTRLRLNIFVPDDSGTERPAVLEVRSSAFAALETALKSPEDVPITWCNILFRISVIINPRGFEDVTFDRIF